jgi:hypothetical protein
MLHLKIIIVPIELKGNFDIRPLWFVVQKMMTIVLAGVTDPNY